MSAPVVAVVAARRDADRVAGRRGAAQAVPEAYLACLRRAGVHPIVLPLPGPEPPERSLEGVHGLVLVGGGDVDPSRYGARPHPEVYGVDPDRDAYEVGLVRAAASDELPTLAICRGVQVMNVAFGGTLLQHLPDVPGLGPHGDRRVHEVRVAEGSRLAAAAGRPTVAGWSSHHQGIGRTGRGLVPVAWTEDGLVEAVEHEDGWMLGVQWHPEQTAGEDPAQQALFDALAERARQRAGG